MAQTFAAIVQRNNGDKIDNGWFNILQQAGLNLESVANLNIVVSSATPLILTSASVGTQLITGSIAQPIVMPNTTTIYIGRAYKIVNRSSATVSVYAADGTTLLGTIPTNNQTILTVLTNATSNGTWDFQPVLLSQLSGEASTPGSGSNIVTLSNSAVIGKVLTGFTSGAGTVSATDSILSAIQKLNGNIAALGSPSLISTTVTGTTTVSSTYDIYFVNAAGGGFTVTFPAASSLPNKLIRIKKIDSSSNIVTVSGTADGQSSRTLTSINQTLVYYSDGTNYYVFEIQEIRSSIAISTANGYGSTDTMIPRFTTTDESIGSAITYADSATAGTTFTINEDGVYSGDITYFVNSGGGNVGFSKNATVSERSANILTAVSSSNRLTCETNSAGNAAHASFTRFLKAADIIRPHTDGVSAGAATARCFCSVTKVSN